MIKLLATLFMFIDHVGMILFPYAGDLRLIGRISMPLFAYCVARGFYYTNKKKTTGKYLRRLVIFSFISQIPYSLSMCVIGGNVNSLNIGFTWVLGLSLMWIFESYNKNISLFKKIVLISIFFLIIALSFLLEISYGLSGVLYPLSFYLMAFKKNKDLNFVSTSTLILILSLTYIAQAGIDGLTQIFAVSATPILLIAKKHDERIKLPKRFFYIFYPLHLFVLAILALVLN